MNHSRREVLFYEKQINPEFTHSPHNNRITKLGAALREHPRGKRSFMQMSDVDSPMRPERKA